MKILEYELVKTCERMPEQYDVFHHGEQVGYLRLRHGYFAAYRFVGDSHPLYEAETVGDGEFMDNERKFHLTQAIKAIRKNVSRELRHGF